MSSSSNTKLNKVTGHRPTWSQIDLEALTSNFNLIKTLVGSAVNVMAVVKANAYGHGAVECARRLEVAGADWFGVALPEEGIELRKSGIERPILCLGGFWKGQEKACLQNNLTPVVYRLEMLDAFDRAAKDAGSVASVHIKIDTGMGRLGIRSSGVSELCQALAKFKNIRVDGLMTHFAAADDSGLERFTLDQLQAFAEMAHVFRSYGHQVTHQHLANSAATFALPKARGTMIRPGGALYGLRDTLSPEVDSSALRPVMSLHSRISLLKWIEAGEPVGYGCTFRATRRTLVGTIPIGYEDGYRRALSNRGQTIVKGGYAPVIGRVSMDLSLIDVTDIKSVRVDDAVTLLGSQDGLTVFAEEMASEVGTISYEITCGISQRVPRVYSSQ